MIREKRNLRQKASSTIVSPRFSDMQNELSETGRKSWLPRLLLLGLAVFLSAAFCELLLRLTTREPVELSLLRGDDFQTVYFEPDPVLGVVRRPNLDLRFRFEERPSGFIHFRTNNLALRRAAPTRVGKFAGTRVLALGDSQIDGSVDNRENVCSLLERRLNSRAERYEVLNAAIGSYSPYQSYLWYRSRGKVLEPDLILLTVYLGNDLAELVAPGRPRLMPVDATFREISVTEDYQRRMQAYREPSGWRRMKFFLLQHSVLFGRLTSLVGGSGVETTGPMATAYRTCLGCTGQSLGQTYWFKHHPGDLKLSLRSLEELLRRFKLEADQAGSRLVVLVLPSRLEVEAEQDADRIRETARVLDLNDQDLQLEIRLGEQTLGIARMLGLSTVDLTPILTQAHRKTGENLFYRTDWHLDAAGHRALADGLYRCLFE